MMFEFAKWFFDLIRPPVKECVDCRLKEEVAELRKLVDSMCVHTQHPHEDGTPERYAQLKIEGKASMHGFRLVQAELARQQLIELESKKKELLQDNPHLMMEQNKWPN